MKFDFSDWSLRTDVLQLATMVEDCVAGVSTGRGCKNQKEFERSSSGKTKERSGGTGLQNVFFNLSRILGEILIWCKIERHDAARVYVNCQLLVPFNYFLIFSIIKQFLDR